MSVIPRITAALTPIDLSAETLVLGDASAVAAKGTAAYAKITRWAAEVSQLPAQINATTEALSECQGAIAAILRPDVVDVGGAERYSAAYAAAIEAVSVTVDDVFDGRVLRVTGIAPSGIRPIEERFVAEIGPDGPRWAGPLLAQLGSLAQGANTAPVADAGDDITIQLGQTLRRTAVASDADGQIVAYEWREGSRVLSIREVLVLTPDQTGDRTIELRVEDDRGERSAPSSFVLSVEQQAISAYSQAAIPSGVSTTITDNRDSQTRAWPYSRRPVFTVAGDALVVHRAVAGKILATTYDVIALDGTVLAADIRAEREVMAAFTDADTVYGIRDYNGGRGQQLVRANWRAGTFELIYEPGGALFIGDGRGRISNDDRYVVVRQASGGKLVCIDMRTSLVVGSMPTPTNYRWASITPDGQYVIVASDEIARHDRDFGDRTPLVASVDEGDCALAADGTVYFVQCGAVPRIINVSTGAVTNIDTGSQAAEGSVSGVCLVPGYVCATWRLGGGAHEIVTMDLADGAQMWTQRVSWASVPYESRLFAQPQATPRGDGRRIVYLAADNPGAGDYNIQLT